MTGLQHVARPDSRAAYPVQMTGKIDRAFRIATPMRKVSWTKRFAAVWGRASACDGRSSYSKVSSTEPSWASIATGPARSAIGQAMRWRVQVESRLSGGERDAQISALSGGWLSGGLSGASTGKCTGNAGLVNLVEGRAATCSAAARSRPRRTGTSQLMTWTSRPRSGSIRCSPTATAPAATTWPPTRW